MFSTLLSGSESFPPSFSAGSGEVFPCGFSSSGFVSWTLSFASGFSSFAIIGCNEDEEAGATEEEEGVEAEEEEEEEEGSSLKSSLFSLPSSCVKLCCCCWGSSSPS